MDRYALRGLRLNAARSALSEAEEASSEVPPKLLHNLATLLLSVANDPEPSAIHSDADAAAHDRNALEREAFSLLQRGSALADFECLFALATCVERGRGISGMIDRTDININDSGAVRKRAFDLFHAAFAAANCALEQDGSNSAALKCRAKSSYNIGVYWQTGLGVDHVSEVEALKCYLSAAEDGFLRAMYNGALLLLQQDGTNMTQSFELLKNDSDEQETNLETDDGNIQLAEDQRTVRNVAARVAQTSDEMDAPSAVASSGSVPQNISAGLRWLKLAAEGGHAEAQAALGRCFDRGVAEYLDADAQQAFRWFEAAAKQGLSSAQVVVGAYYEEGFGVDVDMAAARHFYSLAAAQGDEDAAEALLGLPNICLTESHVARNVDSRGVVRGGCKNPTCECEEFESGLSIDTASRCDYCDHGAAVHENRNSLPTNT